MSIQKLIGTVALLIAAYTAYELVVTSRVTSVAGKITNGAFYTAAIGLEVPLVYFNNNPRNVTLAHYHSNDRFKSFVLLPFLLLVAGLGFTGRLKKTSDRF
jgi:hypothetical protein